MLNKQLACRCVRVLFISALLLSTVTGQSVNTRIKAPPADRKESGTEEQQSKRTSNTHTDSDGNNSVALDPKRQQAIDLIEGVLLRAARISPVDYRILVEVEAATNLWDLERDRATSLLKHAITLMRELFEKKEGSSTVDRLRESRNRKLRFLVLQKIAKLKADLVQELFQEKFSKRPAEAVQAEWTDEARAVISLATDQIQNDPKTAARLFEQSLALGTADWTTFLENLAQRDNSAAERSGTVLIDLLRDSSVTPLVLRNLRHFALASDRSPAFRDHFFQSIAIRLRRDVRPDVTTNELGAALSVSREMTRETGVSAPNLQPEFDALRVAFEGVLSARSLPSPGSPAVKMLSVPTTAPTQPGDTREIADAVSGVARLSNSQERDKQYQKLAVDAAEKSDIGLAEEIMSKIADDSLRRSATLPVYSPVVRRAISDSDWPQAQKYAVRILEPLGRTLAFERIAQAMSAAKQEKQSILDLYSTTLKELDRESPNEQIARAYLVVARPIYALDQERGIEAIRSFAYALNKLTIKDEPFEESSIDPATATWVRFTNTNLRADEILNLSDLVLSAFQDLARRDADSAISIALALRHEGMYSLAQLGISRMLLEQSKKQPGPPGHKQPTQK